MEQKTPRQESELRMAELICDIVRLDRWHLATPHEQRIVLAQLMILNLKRTHRPKKGAK